MRSAQLHISLTQKHLGERTSTTLSHDAEGTAKGASFFIRYIDQLEGQEDGRIPTILRIESTECSLLRQGAVQMKQVFQKGMTTHGTYTTEYGTFQTETYTNKLRIEREGADPTRVVIAYQMWLNGQYIGEFEMDVRLVWKGSERES